MEIEKLTALSFCDLKVLEKECISNTTGGEGVRREWNYWWDLLVLVKEAYDLKLEEVYKPRPASPPGEKPPF